MSKNIQVRLGICVLVALLVVGYLYISKPPAANQLFKGFDRLVWDGSLLVKDRLTLPDGQYYIAGTQGDSLYLGHAKRLMRLLQIDAQLREKAEIRLFADSIPFKAIMLKVDEGDFYITDGGQPFILKGNTANWKAEPYVKDHYFLMTTALSPHSMVLMSFVDAKNTLGKWSSSQRNAQWFPALIEQQMDGFFSSFGQLHRDKKTNRTIYLYNNRNQYVVTDTNMNLIYRANTIDTISWAKIKVGKAGKNRTSLASPAMPVNLHSTVADGLLYVHSNIMAANEPPDTFKSNHVIDLYDLNKGTYLYSFYLPKIKRKPLLDFRVMGKRLIALYSDELISFDITPAFKEWEYAQAAADTTCSCEISNQAN